MSSPRLAPTTLCPGLWARLGDICPPSLLLPLFPQRSADRITLIFASRYALYLQPSPPFLRSSFSVNYFGKRGLKWCCSLRLAGIKVGVLG